MGGRVLSPQSCSSASDANSTACRFVPKGLYLLAVSPPALLVVEEMPLCTGLGWAVWLTPAVGVMLGPGVAITPGRCCWCSWLGWCQSSLCDLGHAAWLP